METTPSALFSAGEVQNGKPGFMLIEVLEQHGFAQIIMNWN